MIELTWHAAQTPAREGVVIEFATGDDGWVYRRCQKHGAVGVLRGRPTRPWAPGQEDPHVDGWLPMPANLPPHPSPAPTIA